MSRYYYDLHIHSCLSPCADNDNTPHSIAGMGVLAGLQIMALTDHNTCRNCPAFCAAAEEQGIIPVPGMELTTAEDIHMVCLFPSLDAAMAFDDAIRRRRVLIPNRPAIFGEQWIMDECDNIIGSEEHLLSNATTVSVEESVPLVESFGGVCYPAHIDREANGILAVLGALPEKPVFPCVELHDGSREPEIRTRHLTPETRVLVSSDAHVLWDIRDKEHRIDIPDEPGDGKSVCARLIDLLRSGQ